MKGGDPGIRLFGNSGKTEVEYFTPAEVPFKPVKGELLIVPVYRIFGSEELSSNAPAINERIEQPFILMNSKDAAVTGIKENNQVKITVSQKTIDVKLKIADDIPEGMAGLAAGLPGMAFLELPGFGIINKI
jgi:NADH-quinone oxidoreductase subunit G